MIDVRFQLYEEHFISLTVSGHAYADEPGKDLVCAAVSTLAQTLVNAVESVGVLAENAMNCELENGFLHFEIDKSVTSEAIDIVFKTILIGIEGIQNTYPKYVSCKIEEVHGNVKNI